MQRHFRPISSLTRRPVHTATKIIVAYGSGTRCIRLLNCSGATVGFARLARLSRGSRSPSIGFLLRYSTSTAARRIEDRTSLIFEIDRLNAATKYVVTHRPESLEWGPFEAIESDLADSVRRIKARKGPDLVVAGSSTLTSVLLDHGL